MPNLADNAATSTEVIPAGHATLTTEEELGEHRPDTSTGLAGLSVAALGVVFGDIGTSPVYTFRECFNPEHGLPLDAEHVLGVLSMIFWVLIIVVAVKYVLLIMRADNQGEGGILALLALAQEAARGERSRTLLVLLALGGAALFFGDSMITPAISVLSALEGISIATPALDQFVPPLAVVVLLGLFLFQKSGTERVGHLFGPAMALWFAVIAIIGGIQIAEAPRVLEALNPAHAIGIFVAAPAAGFVVLGAVALAITGGEALYADMGHFGRLPIRLAWFAVVLPALVLNYFGQGALILGDKTAIENPFFRMAPSWGLFPLVLLSTTATVIASQQHLPAYGHRRQASRGRLVPHAAQSGADRLRERRGGNIYLRESTKGARKQSTLQKEDLSQLFGGHKDFKDCDYVTGWFIKAAECSKICATQFAFVATNSIAQGEQVAHLWSRLYKMGMHIHFSHRTFLWRNNAQNNAGVHCVIIGVDSKAHAENVIYEDDTARIVKSISPYLTAGEERYVVQSEVPLSADVPAMVSGNMARDGGNLILSRDEADNLVRQSKESTKFIKKLVGTKEINQGQYRYCLWITDDELENANRIDGVRNRIDRVREMRLFSEANTTRQYAKIPHKFAQRCHRFEPCIAIPKTITGEDAYLTPTIYTGDVVVSDLAFVVYPLDFVAFSVISSALHLVWAETVAGGMRDGLRYSSQLAYHTFPIPTLTEKNKADLARCAEDILLAREEHFPATIADLYDPEKMPADLREAHDRNDEVLERIYIGRRFRNDTERLEKLFELYTRMTAGAGPMKKRRAGAST